MKKKKVLRGTAFAVLAVTAWLGTGKADASAQILDTDITNVAKVKVDTDAQQMKITPEASDKEVLISIAKKGKKRDSKTKTTKTVFKMSQWDVHDTNGQTVTVDLSKLSNTRENFIAVKTEDMKDPFIVRIPAVDKVNVITYNAQSNELEFKAGSKKDSATPVSSFQYKTPYSGWIKGESLTEGKATVFSKYQYQGLGIYLRTPATKTDEALTLNNSDDYKDVYNSDSIDTKLNVYDAGSFAGKITKINIAKRANGPSVPVQYTANTVTLPKAVEYRVLIKNGDTYAFKEWKVTATTDKTIKEADKSKSTPNVKITDLLGATTQGIEGILEVRTASKSNSNPKLAKCASNWTRIAMEVAGPLSNELISFHEVNDTKVETATTTTIENKRVKVTTTTWGGLGVKNAMIVKIGSDGKPVTQGDKPVALVTVDYSAAALINDNWVGTVKFTNLGSDAYQIVVSDKTNDKTVEEAKNDINSLVTTGAKTLSAKRTLSWTHIKDRSYIYICKAGNQSKKTWAGAYSYLGRVDVPKKTTTSSAIN